jgi:peroxiredoxin
MRTIASSLVWSLGVAAALLPVAPLANAQPTLPRKAPEIIIAESSGRQTPLSSYKGKVVVLAFISTECPHCQKECEMLSGLYSEMKSKGVQMAAIAFNDNAAVLVPNFIRDHNVNFPVGTTKVENVLNFQGFSVMDRPSVPQVAIVDKKGMIREQSEVRGTPNLQDPVYLRTLINKLLAEGATTTTSKSAPATKAATKGTSNFR